MTDLNKRLHEVLELPLHNVLVPDSYKTDACWECSCGKKNMIHAEASKHREENKPQDLLAQVTVPCDACGGEGEVIDKPDFVAGALKPLPYQCPSCNGLKTRRITRLQQILEERGEWKKFLRWLGQNLIDDYADILTDANKLGQAYLEWRKG